MYEPSTVPPVSTSQFVRRLLGHFGYGAAVIAVSLAAGTIGFVAFAGEAPIDAFLNAAMLLGGMGPVGDLSRASAGGKLFAAGFALYSGLVFLLVAGLVLTPVLHRVVHRFHWDRERSNR